jgi:protein-disulfide isomerase
MKSPWTIPLAIAFGGIVIAGALYVSLPKTASNSANTALTNPVSAQDHILGNPTAPVVIITYTDFDCEHCKDFHETMNQVIADAGTKGKVAWVLRQFPLTEINPNAFSHARASECAATGGNDVFWKFADALFKAQPVKPEDYSTVAESAEIQGDAFAKCVATPDKSLDARINADRDNALAIGAQGAPYSVIVVNGTPVDVMEGGYSYSAVEAKIKEVSK